MSSKDKNSGSNSQFSVDINTLKQGGRSIDATVDPKWLNEVVAGCEYPVTATDAAVNAIVEARPSGVQVAGKVQFSVVAECATCLADVPLTLTATLDTFLRPADEVPADEENELTPDDLAFECYTGDRIELDDLIGDSILLELPMTPRCATECKKTKYLVTQSEAEQNKQTVDPRLQALADIKLSKES